MCSKCNTLKDIATNLTAHFNDNLEDARDENWEMYEHSLKGKGFGKKRRAALHKFHQDIFTELWKLKNSKSNGKDDRVIGADPVATGV